VQRYLVRLRVGRRLYFLLAVISLLNILGCSSSPQLNEPQPTDESVTHPSHLLTVLLEAGDTPQTIQGQYGGSVLVWEEDRYAVLGVTEDQAKAAASQSSKVTLERNSKQFKSVGEVGMNGRSTLWAGGRSTIWAGGRSTLWSGGRSTLWAGGEFSWMPENTSLWQQIRLEQGHALAPNLGYGIKVAVIDTGVDLTHPALQEALAPASEWWDFYGGDAVPQEEGSFVDVGYGHGTNVAGIIRQIAPRATILPVRVLGPDGTGDVASVAAGIQWAMNKGAKVINLSLGSEASLKAVEEVIKQATGKGILVVASTGNTGNTKVTWPASSAAEDKNLLRISVTSVDSHDRKSSFATYGKSVELSAPGELVYGPAPDLNMAAWSGTSQAAPMASGALALALGETLVVPARNLADELSVRATDVYNNSLNETYKDGLGKGRLNLEEFLRNVVKY
jgi:thermitase